jgi:hypothetical protein
MILGLLGGLLLAQAPKIDCLALSESRPLGYAKTHHVQGLAIDEKRVYVSSVERAGQLGWLFIFDRSTLAIESTHRFALAGQYHPGGMQRQGKTLHLPLAEYRKESSASLLTIDLAPLDATLPRERTVLVRHWLPMSDHVGGLACDDQGVRYAANWDSRTVKVIDPTGTIRHEWTNPTGVAYQDMEWHDGLLWCAGNARSKGGMVSVVDALEPTEGKWVRRWELTGQRADGQSDFAHEGFTKEGNALWFLPEDGPRSTLYRFDLDLAR